MSVQSKRLRAETERAEKIIACIYSNQPISRELIVENTGVNQDYFYKIIKKLSSWVFYSKTNNRKRYYHIKDDEDSKRIAKKAFSKHGGFSNKKLTNKTRK